MAIPGLRVTGNVAPDIENPVPDMVPELTVTGAVPDEVRVKPSEIAVPTGSLPKLKLLVLRDRMGVPLAPVPLK